MAFPGLRYASTGILAALKAGSKLRPSATKKESGLGVVSGAATTVETEIEPAVASMAHLQRILSTYLEKKDIGTIRDAYRFSDEAHLGQLRSSGSPYITHPISVAEICAGWKLDAQAIQAALLHDVMEDQGIAKQDLLEKFGDEVAELVDGLSKLDRLEFATKAQQQPQ
jgi:(p)ppGpp synthase/HD superfamily hydrolase